MRQTFIDNLNIGGSGGGGSGEGQKRYKTNL